MAINNIVGERIRERRIQLGMTQEQLAEATGYNGRSAINKIEMLARGINQKKLSIFAKALKTSEVYLLGIVDDPEWKMEEPPKQDIIVHFSADEEYLIEQYRKADDEKKRLIEYLLNTK